MNVFWRTRTIRSHLKSLRAVRRNPAVRILLTFTGFHDPYSRGLVGEDDQPGPILSLLRERQFDLVCLLSTPNTEKNTRETSDLVARQVATEQLHVPLQDPTDYAAILTHLS